MPEPKKKLLEAVDRMKKMLAAAEKTKKVPPSPAEGKVKT